MNSFERNQIIEKFEKSYGQVTNSNTFRAYSTALKQILDDNISITSKSKYLIFQAVFTKCEKIGIELDAILPVFTKRGNNDKKNIIDKQIDDTKFAQIIDCLKNTKEQIQLKRALEISYNTGLRLNEILNLKKDDITINQDIITISVNGKGCKARKVYLPKKYLHLIENWQNFTISDQYVIVTLNRISKRLGFLFSFHSLRHSYAIRQAQKLNIFELQKILGHSSITTTSIYLKYMDDSSIIEKLKN